MRTRSPPASSGCLRRQPASQYRQVVASTGVNAQMIRFSARVRSLDRMLGVV
jgi:hypothetical protein